MNAMSITSASPGVGWNPIAQNSGEASSRSKMPTVP